jgi:glutamine amidotransferase-like uncharacterized protein
MPTGHKSNITLYAGAGAHLGELPQAVLREIDHRQHSLRLIDARDLTNHPDCLEDTAVFFMPGGADLPYCAALNGAGNAVIRRFVESGGVYVGICAGAYYGARRIAFHVGQPDEITGSRELSFFPGMAEGSLPGLGLYYDMTKRSASTPLLQSYNGIQFTSYYHGGCRFVPDDSADFNILARYPDNSIAIVSMQAGNGKAILSGVHLERSSASVGLDLDRLTDGDRYRHLVTALQSHDTQRHMIWRDLLKMAGLQLSEEGIAA